MLEEEASVREDAAAAAEFTAVCWQLFKILPLVLGFLLGTLVGAIVYVRIGLRCVLAAMLIIAGLITWSLSSAREHNAAKSDGRPS